MTALRETHNLNHRSSKFEVSKGDVVLVRTDEKNRGKWPLAIVRATYPGRDGVVRAVQVETSKGLLERPVQHLYPLELACDKVPSKEQPLNPQAAEFLPKRPAAVVASKNIKLIMEQEQRLL